MMFILVAQVLALYVMGCCITGLVGCSTQFWKDMAYSTADCTATSALGCAMQVTGGCQLPSVGAGEPAWDDYGMCLSTKAQSCAVSGIARCTVSAVMKASAYPIVAGGAPCDQEEVDLCVLGSMCASEKDCVESVATCYDEVCTK